jgi:hypothetical protein
MIAVRLRMRDAGEMDQSQFAAFYAPYAEQCIRAGVRPLEPEQAVALLADLEYCAAENHFCRSHQENI